MEALQQHKKEYFLCVDRTTNLLQMIEHEESTFELYMKINLWCHPGKNNVIKVVTIRSKSSSEFCHHEIYLILERQKKFKEYNSSI